MNRGEIWDANLPLPPGGSGHEQMGPRPVLIIQATIEPANPMVAIIPLTSNPNAMRFSPSRKITATANNGLNRDSIAMVQQISTLDKRKFIQNRGGIAIDLH